MSPCTSDFALAIPLPPDVGMLMPSVHSGCCCLSEMVPDRPLKGAVSTQTPLPAYSVQYAEDGLLGHVLVDGLSP